MLCLLLLFTIFALVSCGEDTSDSSSSDSTSTGSSETVFLTVTFYDAEHKVLKTEQVAYGGAATAPTEDRIPERPGYIFTGWDSDFSDIKVDTDVIAQYARIFRVNFIDYDGTVLSTQIIMMYGAATAPEVPERPGYVFTGWDCDFDRVTSDLNITAQYVADE